MAANVACSGLADRIPDFSENLLAVVNMAAGVEQDPSPRLRQLGEQAFQALVQTLEPDGNAVARALLLRFHKPAEDAKDIVQTASYRLWKNGLRNHQYRLSCSDVLRYFRAIVRHETANFLRKKMPVSGGTPLPSRGGNGLDEIIEGEETRRIIEALPEREREVLLCRAHGFNSDQTAEATRLTKEQVFRYYHKARKRFREMWRQRQRRLEDAAWLEALVEPEAAVRVLTQLPPADQELLGFLLAHYSVQEISEMIGRTKAEVHGLVRAAKERFSNLWDEQHPLGPSSR
jgi:RNA polymerase sigma factor (sigma-70 family)